MHRYAKRIEFIRSERTSPDLPEDLRLVSRLGDKVGRATSFYTGC